MNSRKPSTKRSGKDFTEEEEKEVWEKAQMIDGKSPDTKRRDACGAIIKYEDYGNRQSEHGWEVDHIKPVEKGGGDEMENLQPLHWRNNVSKSDNYPTTTDEYCKVF